MGRFLSLPIRRYMVILIVLMTVAPLGIIIYSAARQQNDALCQARRQAAKVADQICSDQNVLLSGTEQLLATLSNISSVQRRDAKAVNTLLAKLIKKSPRYTNIFMADDAGRLWASALPLHGIVNVSDRRFFRNAVASGRFSSGEYTIGRVLKRPALSFGYPIKDASGKSRDIAAVAFTLGKYIEKHDEKAFPVQSSVILTDHKGTIFQSQDSPQLIGKQDRPEIFRHMSAGPDNGTFEAAGNNGERRIYAYRKLRVDGEQEPYMYVRVGIPVGSVINATRSNLKLNTALLSAVMLLTLGLAAYIGKRGIMDKIVTLRDATQKVARGDLGVRVADHVSGGELGELALAFDRMAERLAGDTAERKQAEEAILRLNEDLDRRVAERTEQLEAAVREHEAFSYTVSHDLRSPLRHINSYSAILVEEFGGHLPAEARTYLDRLCAASSRMEKLIDDLLLLSRVSRTEMRNETVSLSEMAADICALMQETEPERSVEFVIAEGLTVPGDPVLLRQLMENLLGNAWKYTGKIPRARIEFGRSEFPGEAPFFIRDNGAGFDMAFREKLFGAFQRLHGEDYEGNGIGLATVQRIVSRHGGRVWAKGKVNEGAIFYFTLQVEGGSGEMRATEE